MINPWCVHFLTQVHFCLQGKVAINQEASFPKVDTQVQAPSVMTMTSGQNTPSFTMLLNNRTAFPACAGVYRISLYAMMGAGFAGSPSLFDITVAYTDNSNDTFSVQFCLCVLALKVHNHLTLI